MNSFTAAPGVAIWRQIADTLAADISAAAFKSGEKLPTEANLSQRFQVNRHTVRRAIAALVEQGIVRVEQGRGTFVAEDVVEYTVGERPRFTETMSAQRRTPGGRLLRAMTLPADETVAAGLKIRRGMQVIMLERLAEADGRPISIGTHYFPAKRFTRLIEFFGEEGSITRSLSRCGVEDYTRLSTRVSARRATSDEARILQLPAAAPVLETRAVNTDPAGKRVEFGVSSFASNRVELLFET